MYKRMKMLLGGLILSTGLVVSTPVSYAAETQVRGEEDIELAYENMGECRAEISISSNQAKCTTVVQRKNKKTVHISMIFTEIYIWKLAKSNGMGCYFS